MQKYLPRKIKLCKKKLHRNNLIDSTQTIQLKITIQRKIDNNTIYQQNFT